MVKRKMFAGAEKTIFQNASRLRRTQTHAEQLLWQYLRTRPLNCKFRRQHPFLNYVLDFYCHELKLVIEIDGSIHEVEEIKQNDERRQSILEDHGLSVLRIGNELITNKPEDAIEQLIKMIEHKKSNSNGGK